MHTIDTAVAAARTARVRAVRDRLDSLFLGRGKAARHRVLRLLDPAAAAEYRRAAYGADSAAPEAPKSNPEGPAAKAWGRLRLLLANDAAAADMAA